MDMDEEYLADERKFEQNLKALESKRPATPRHHVHLLQLLDEIDALASAAEIQASDLTFDDTTIEEVRGESPFSYKPKVEHDVHDSFHRVLPHRQTIRTVTPPLESLPYLSSGPPTPFSDLEELQDSSGFQVGLSEALFTLIILFLGLRINAWERKNTDSELYCRIWLILRFLKS